MERRHAPRSGGGPRDEPSPPRADGATAPDDDTDGDSRAALLAPAADGDPGDTLQAYLRQIRRAPLLSPEEALNAGLVDEITLPGAVQRLSLLYCEKLLALPEAAINAMRDSFHEEVHPDLYHRDAIIDEVKKGKGTLGALVYDPKAADDLKATIANFRAVSDKISKGEGTLGKLLSDDSLLRDAQAIMKKADRALDGLDDTGPITAAGVVSRGLF